MLTSPAPQLEPSRCPAPRSEIKEDLADWLAETGWEGEQKAEDLADALTTWTQRSETAKLAALLDSMAARWPHVPELASKLVLPAAQCGHVAVIMLLHECAPLRLRIASCFAVSQYACSVNHGVAHRGSHQWHCNLPVGRERFSLSRMVCHLRPSSAKLGVGRYVPPLAGSAHAFGVRTYASITVKALRAVMAASGMMRRWRSRTWTRAARRSCTPPTVAMPLPSPPLSRSSPAAASVTCCDLQCSAAAHPEQMSVHMTPDLRNARDLAQCGALVDAVDYNQQTALMIAIFSGALWHRHKALAATSMLPRYLTTSLPAMSASRAACEPRRGARGLAESNVLGPPY